MAECSLRTGASSGTAWAFLTPALVLISLSVLIPAAMALVMVTVVVGAEEKVAAVAAANPLQTETARPQYSCQIRN